MFFKRAVIAVALSLMLSACAVKVIKQSPPPQHPVVIEPGR
jgi:hypothetical protein